MSDPLRPRVAGDSFPTSRQTLNPILEVARKAVANGPRVTSKPNRQQHRIPGAFRFKNETGETVGRYNWISIQETYYDPDQETELDRFNIGQPVMIGIKPSRMLPIACVLRPARDDEPGLAMLVGTVQSTVQIHNENHGYARPINDDTTKLESTPHATTAQIIGKPNGTGEKSCVISLGLVSPSVAWVQAPSGGIPAATGSGSGTAACEVLVRATTDGTDYSAGDFVRTGETIEVYHGFTGKSAGEEGDRRVQVTGHYDGAEVIGWSCENERAATDIKSE